MDPPEARRRRGSRRRDPGDHPAASSSQVHYDLGGGHRFSRRAQPQHQNHQQQQFQYPQRHQQQYSSDPYSDAGSHASHHRKNNNGHSHHHHQNRGSQGSYQNAYQHGPLHQRLSQGHVARHQRHDDGFTWGTHDSFTYQSQQNHHRREDYQNHHHRDDYQRHHHRGDYDNHENERYFEVQTEPTRLPPEERYDYYDAIAPNNATTTARRSSSLGHRASRSSTSLSNRHPRSRNSDDSYNNLDGTVTNSKSNNSRKSFPLRRRGSRSMDDVTSLHIDEHNSDHRSYEEDQFVGKMGQQQNNTRDGRLTMQSSSSIGSGRRRGRTRSDYSHGEDSDYVVGGSVQSTTHRRLGSDPFSDDATYDGLFDDDDESRSDGRSGSGNWSVSKSVFSTLPDRHRRTRGGRGDGSFKDDEDGTGSVISTSSRGTAYSSCSSRQKRFSTSSSVHSRLSQEESDPSQSVQQSQTSRDQIYKPARSKSNNFSYDSDDSINSLLDGFEGVKEDRIPSEVASEEDEDVQLIPPDPDELMNDAEREHLAADLLDTRSHLKSLGFGIDPSDDEKSNGDIEFYFDMKEIFTDDKVDDDQPWWIRDLEGKGWFKHDTSSAYAKRNFAVKRKQSTDFDENIDTSLRASLESTNESAPNEQTDDSDDTSTVDMVEEGDDIENWEERLWSLARTHYLEYSGTSSGVEDETTDKASANKMSPDEQSVKEQEQIYYDEYRAEQEGVLLFRSLLLKCVDAYAASFHSKVKQVGSANEHFGCSRDPDEMGDLDWTDHHIPLKVNHYVPLPLARILFAEVIQIEEGGANDNDSSSAWEADIDRRAGVIASILIESDLNIFRCYQVITVKTSSKITSDEKERRRKRLNTSSAKQSNSAQSELEQFLYGEMYAAEEEKDDDNHITETREVEVRLCSKLVTKLLGRRNVSLQRNARWEETVASKVLLKLIQRIVISSAAQSEEGTIVSSFQLEEQPIAQLYSLRYAPVFLLRALHKVAKDAHVFAPSSDDAVRSDSHLVNYQDLAGLLRDTSYLLKRFELQGPYNGTITHLSDWESSFHFRSNCERQKRDDNEEYFHLHDLLVTTLHSHLQTTVEPTGYKIEAPSDNEEGESKKEEVITTDNYAKIVAICLEIGRALHHLGVCLGRRLRDLSQARKSEAADDDADSLEKRGVTLEVTAYKKALESYKAAIHILSEAEASASLDDGDDDKVVDRNGDKQKNKNENNENEAERQQTSGQDKSSDELHQIRDAKITVELHLADTLTCLGYCHDAKLGEYEKALMAYRESLSLYIRHVGRFHRMVSNALHNMGAIHVELHQWKDAATCYRQCLAIVRRKEEQERAEWAQSGRNTDDIVDDQLSKSFVSSMNEDIAATLQCLGNSLAELGEYDASIACFQEVVDRLDSSTEIDEKMSTPPNAHVGEVLSQMASAHFKEASKLSQSLNWQCHMLIFSGTETKKSDDPQHILSRQLAIEKIGKECISKSIFSRRTSCYCAITKESQAVGIFSNDRKRRFSNSMIDPSDDEERTTYTIQKQAPSEVMESLAVDLLAAGRLEFRARDYGVALSYFWECFLVRLFLLLRPTSSFDVIKDEFILNKELLTTEGAVLKDVDDILSLVDLVDETSCASNGSEFVQLLYLIGKSYSRNEDFANAKEILHKAQHLHNTLLMSTNEDNIIENNTFQLDAAMLHMGIGFVDSQMGDFPSAKGHYKEAAQILDATSSVKDASVSAEEKQDSGVLVLQQEKLRLVVNSCAASAYCRLGQIHFKEKKSDIAMKYLEDTMNVLNEVHDARTSCLNPNAMQSTLLPASCCFSEDISVVSSVMILTDVNESSATINMHGGSDFFSLQCFERAIGLREFFTNKMGSLSRYDLESSLEKFEDSQWDKGNMHCYSGVLMLLEKREDEPLQMKGRTHHGQGETWKVHRNFDFNKNVSSENSDQPDDIDEEEILLTKEDVLFRIANLQAKGGQYRTAISYFEEAEELTVSRLGTRDHAIVMNILHNMGNSFRAIALSASRKEMISAYEKAVACYSEAIRISHAFYGSQHVSSAESMQNLGVLHMRAGKTWLAIFHMEDKDSTGDELALKSFKDALKIRKREKGSRNEIEIASILHHMGDLCLRKIEKSNRVGPYSDTKKLAEEALKYLNESLKIQQHFFADDKDTQQSIGVAHMYHAMTMNDDVDKMKDEMTKAIAAFTYALEAHKTLSTSPFENDNAEDAALMEAQSLFHLGRAEEGRSQYEQARQYFTSALQHFQAEGKQKVAKLPQGNDDGSESVYVEGKLLVELEAINLWTARILRHMAHIHKETGFIDNSASCYEECLRIRSQCKAVKKKGANNAMIKHELASCLYDAQRYDESLEYLAQCLQPYVIRFGKNSVEVADLLSDMGKSLAMKSKYEKSVHCYDKALHYLEYRDGITLKEKKGLLHRQVADTIICLGGEVVEALEHYRSSVSFLEEYNEWHRGKASVTEANSSDKQLLLYYSEMLALLRQAFDTEDMDQNAEIELTNEIGDVLHRMGNLHATFGEYDEALTCFSEVLDIQRKTNNDELRIADLLFNMGNIFLEQDLAVKSIDCLRESYDITKEALGGENKELHSTMYLMGVALTELADYENALAWFDRALAALKSVDEEDIPDEAARGRTLLRMGTVYERTGDQNKALTCFQQSIQILKEFGGSDVEVSNALNSMGNILRNSSDFEQALSSYDQSLTIRTRVGDELLIANTKNNIGAALSATDKADDAMAFAAEALKVKTAKLGPDDVETGKALVNVGQLYLSKKEHFIAQQFFQEGLKVFRRQLGKDHPDVAVCMHNIGIIKEAMSDDVSARDHYRESIYIFKNGDDAEKNATLAFSLHNLSLIYVRQNEFEVALEYMSEAYDVKLRGLGADSPETAASQHWLGYIHSELGSYDDALSDFKGALKVRVTCFGTENCDVAKTLFGLGQVHFKVNEFLEAVECLNESLRVLRKFGHNDGDVTKAILLLGNSYQELGQYDEAKECLLEALEMIENVFGKNHIDASLALFRLGICYCETNEYTESLDRFQECLEIRTSLLGNRDIECANTYESIGIVQQKRGCHEEAIHSFERALAIKKSSLDDGDEDFCVILHFIGSSLFALGRYSDSLSYFKDSSERKRVHYGDHDEDYAMSVIDLAAAYAKVGNEQLSMECYHEAVESGGLPHDSWALGVAHKCLGGFFLIKNMNVASLESFNEAVAIFEWNIDNTSGSGINYDDVVECYSRLLDLEEEKDGPISEVRGTLCSKLANSYVHVEKHQDAVLMYREAIMIQSQIFGVDHLSVANSLHNLGNCYRELCEFDKSAECLSKSLTLLSQNYGVDNEDVADTCHCLAETLMSRCELDDAITYLERALAIRRKRLGALDLNIASTLYNLAVISQTKGNWSNAMKYGKEALRIQRMTVGDNSPITVKTLECIGRVHKDKRDFEAAIQCFDKCIANGKTLLNQEVGSIHDFRGETEKAKQIFMKAALHVGNQLRLSMQQPGHEESLDLMNLTSKFQSQKEQMNDQGLLKLGENVMSYGLALVSLEQFNEALECFRFSNNIFQAKYGSDHLRIAENLHHTGYVLEKLGETSACSHQLHEALDLLTEALRIRKLHLVESHPDVEETLLCLGKVHHRSGNIRYALDFFCATVTARDSRLGRKHLRMNDAESFLQVGLLQQEAGEFRQALNSFEECLRIRRQIVKEDDPSLGELLFYIANLVREVGDLDLAQTRFEEALALLERSRSESTEIADVLFSLGVLHTEKQQYSSALDFYLKALQIRKLDPGSTKIVIAEILNNIGLVYFGMKEYDKAQVYHAEALESMIEDLGDDHDDVAFCWHSLGATYVETGDLAEAFKCFDNAVKIERTELYLLSLGICLVQMNDNENAYVCLNEALHMKELDCESNDDDLAEINRNLGTIWLRKGKYEEALKRYDAALKSKSSHSIESEKDHKNLMSCLDGALEAVSQLFGNGHIKYAKLLHQKGNQHGARSEHAQAIEAYVEALRIYKEQYGDTHLSVANTLYNLGVSLNAKGSPDKAVRCFVKALRITKARLGDDHLDVADSYEQIATSNKLTHNYSEAVSFYEKALAVRKQSAGGSDLKSSEIMHEMGILHSDDELWEKAEIAFKESLRIRTIHLGSDDLLVAESMVRLAHIYLSRNENAKALKYFEGSLRIHKSKLKSSDPDLAKIYQSLGIVQAALGSTDKAMFCLDKSIQILCEANGRFDESIALSLARKGELLQANEQYEEALESFQGCLEVRSSFETFESPEAGHILQKMGEIYSILGDNTNASSQFGSALAIYRESFGPKHQVVAEILEKMSAHFVKVGESERGYSCVKEALAIREEVLVGERGNDETLIHAADSRYCMGTILFEWSELEEASNCFEKAKEVYIEKLGQSHLSVANSNYYLGCIDGEFIFCMLFLLASACLMIDSMCLQYNRIARRTRFGPWVSPRVTQR
jgi:tetratricopeptide (TPR) repeat protein